MAFQSKINDQSRFGAEQISIEPEQPRGALGGLFRRQQAWRLTAKGWLVLFLTGVGTIVILVLGVHPFLALTRPASSADVLMVEGWIPDSALLQAAHEVSIRHYRLVLTVGGPLRGAEDPDDTYADAAAKRLRHFITDAEVVPVFTPKVDRDRTYSGALAGKDWLELHGHHVKSIDILTLDVHSRRSRLLGQRAFGDAVTVGIIAAPNPDYDPKHWWKYSEGVREIIGETIAYLYARLFFHPAQ